MKKQFAVIGLGIFGSTLARALSEGGFSVLAIDRNKARAQEASEYVSVSLSIDATDEAAMKEAGLDNMDVAIVCIGENIESNLMATMLLKDIGVGQIIVKAVSETQERVLMNIGVSEIVHPERDMGLRLAGKLIHPDILEFIKLSPEHDLVEAIAPAYIVDMPLSDSKVRTVYGISIIAIKHPGQAQWELNPRPDSTVLSGDLLLVLGRTEDIEEFCGK